MSTSSSLDTVYTDKYVTVTTDDYTTPDGYTHQQGIFKVTFAKGLGLRSKTFKGESAWSNSRRYTEDQLATIGVRVFLQW